MPRYDVLIVATLTYSLAVEASDPMTAQGMGLVQIGDRPAEKVETNVLVERGAQ